MLLRSLNLKCKKMSWNFIVLYLELPETISATTPPPPANVARLWISRKMSPSPTESGRLQETMENVCYYPPPPPNLVGASGDHGNVLLLPPPPPPTESGRLQGDHV